MSSVPEEEKPSNDNDTEGPAESADGQDPTADSDDPSGPPKLPGGGAPRGPEEEEKRPRSSNMPFFIALAVLAIAAVIFYNRNPGNQGTRVKYSFFLAELEKGNIKEVKFHGLILTGKFKDKPKHPDPDKGGTLESEEFNTPIPPIEERKLLDRLIEKKVEFEAENTQVGFGGQLLLWLIGPILIIGFFWFLLRRNSDAMGGGMLGNFIRSPAKRFRQSDQKTTFADVAGMEQAKTELQEIVEFLKNPEKFHRLGATIPKGVLLMGPPGNGKTLVARATAGEADVPFFSISGSEFIQMFVGVGASRVRDLFRTARENAPAIMFVDEIDAVGRVRGAGVGGGHDEREQTLNQILSEMDGFEPTEAVIVMAATNRPDVLDPALLRPGRFDRHITVDRPSKQGRHGILKVHARLVPLDEDVDLEDIAGGTIGFSGADLKNLVNEAALIASREDSKTVKRRHFSLAHDRVLMGPVREEVLSQHEKEMTAYHESGHALLAWLLPELDPVHKVTIVPRGRALGVTQLMPDEESYHIGERKLHAMLAMMLAGRAAEKLVFDEFSAGAEDDIRRATGMARRMVAQWGMSDAIGPVAFRQGEEHPFLGKEMIQEQREFSEETARIIDQEVQRILQSASKKAHDVLVSNRQTLDTLSQALLDEEVLDRKHLTELLGEREVEERATRLRAPANESTTANSA